jgi:hypothetical protein
MSVQVPRRLYGWPAVATPVQSRERERGRHSVRPVQFSTTMNTQVKNAVILFKDRPTGWPIEPAARSNGYVVSATLVRPGSYIEPAARSNGYPS